MKPHVIVGIVLGLVVLVAIRTGQRPGPNDPGGRPAPSETSDIMRRAFEPGAQATAGDRFLSFYVRPVGTLQLPTGSIVASDPVLGTGTPFAKTVRAGDYPVDLSIVRIDDDERVAFARLRFAVDEVATWEMATLPGEALKSLKPDERFGYGVDSGMGAFMDAATCREMERRRDAGRSFSEQLMSADVGAIVPLKRGNIAVFSSGFGDGLYASYWGLNKAGAPVVLVTDFGVVPWK